MEKKMAYDERKDTAAWLFQVWTSFALAFGTTAAGVFYLPVGLWIKAFMWMGLLFTVGSSFTLAKTIRDQHEAERLRNRVRDAKAEKFMRDYEPAP